MTGYTFNQLFDFTRTTAATFVGSNGLIQTTPASVNLLTFTQEFDNGAWVKTETSITANTVAAPDGTATADKFIPSVNATPHYINNSVTATTAQCTGSVYVRLDGSAINKVTLYPGSSATFANFDMATLTVSVEANVTAASITAVGGGWYRLSVTWPAGITVNTLRLYASSGTIGAAGAAGDGTSGIFIWGAQLQLGSTATSYARNNGGLFPPRFDYDPVTLAPRGILIEEQRTNLMLRSEEFDNAVWIKTAVTVATNATTSPNGAVDADAIIENTSTSAHDVYNSAILAAGAQTFNVYVKPNGRSWVNLFVFQGGGASNSTWFNVSTGVVGTVPAGTTASITPVGNGWYRCGITFTALAAAASAYVRLATGDNISSYTGDGTSGIFVWGAQLEAGSFATSYIPTVASQVTRTADVCTITAPMFAPWYNQNEGTFVVEADSVSIGTAGRTVLSLAPGSISPTYFHASGTSANFDGTNLVRSVNTATSNIPAKIGGSYGGGLSSVLNGGAVATGAYSGGFSGRTSMPLGEGLGNLNGHIRRITYYPFRASNNQLQALST